MRYPWQKCRKFFLSQIFMQMISHRDIYIRNLYAKVSGSKSHWFQSYKWKKGLHACNFGTNVGLDLKPSHIHSTQRSLSVISFRGGSKTKNILTQNFPKGYPFGEIWTENFFVSDCPIKSFHSRYTYRECRCEGLRSNPALVPKL